VRFATVCAFADAKVDMFYGFVATRIHKISPLWNYTTLCCCIVWCCSCWHHWAMKLM